MTLSRSFKNLAGLSLQDYIPINISHELSVIVRNTHGTPSNSIGRHIT